MNTTRLFARILGPFHVIIPVVAIVHTKVPSTVAGVFPMSDYTIWPWASGVLLFLVGLTIIALHHRWDSAAACVVTLFGWFMTTRGLLAVGYPAAFTLFHITALWYAVYVGIAAAGMYLTYIGWIQRKL